MEAEEIYVNREVKMQAAAFKEKRGASASKEGANDPNYENITLTFRNRDQPKGSHLPSKTQVPARSRPHSESAQVPHWVHRAIMCLHILLALACIILLALILVKNSETSQELLELKTELLNVSILVQQCQQEQKLGRQEVLQSITEVQGDIDKFKNTIRDGSETLKKLSKDINEMKNKVSEELRKLSNQQSTPQ